MAKGWPGLAAGRKAALFIVAVAAVAGVLAPAARAVEPADAFDDPKLARELPAVPAPPVRAPSAGPAAPAKVSLPPAKPNGAAVSAAPPAAAPPAPKAPPAPPVNAPPAAASVAPAPVAPPPVAAEAPPSPATPPAAAASAPAPLPAPPVAAAAPVPPAPAPEAAVAPVPAEAPPPAPPASGTADLTAKARPPEPPPVAATGPWPYHPRLKLGYRWFSFSRMPSSGSAAAAASESFQSLSLDVYPTSSYLRVGLSSQFGWESGQFQRTGDYFVAESMTTGFQLPGRFTPFVEGLAGAGYMRRLQGASSSPTAYWQLGVDGGVEVYVAKRAYVSVAVGYLHPGNLFIQQKNLSGINADTWSLKVGLGI